MKTKDKIIQVSLRLFNEKGERSITTNHIADEMGISPGLLYYHFTNKEAIIRAIFEQYTDYITQSIVPPDEHSDAEEFLRQYCEQIFDSIWRFRFLHANMPILLEKDNELICQYLQTHKYLEERASEALHWLIEHDLIQIDEAQIAILVDLMRLVTGFWVGFSMINQKRQRLTRKQVSQGIIHLIALLEPYGTAQGERLFASLKEPYLKRA
ncbi:TetR/AcrR family transcriptional regulator [Reinekea blandensis]|uniref:Transcriptional regulator, TetR family protein n=1 Tax=Reinekea blandensis MED297 TaxID=314283 RepID=A4B9Z1_9GAMM|nr:TetR/AcrR family transcriptional regulator [Reinekea blandensis]EAR11442.1 transcriptional regulator, TetR family protein [Reinekea sp. MED297] [Reinekea blandensis MED297]